MGPYISKGGLVGARSCCKSKIIAKWNWHYNFQKKKKIKRKL